MRYIKNRYINSFTSGDTNVVPLASLSSFAGDREENFVNRADVKVKTFKLLIYNK